jgi:hypothetical protein
MRLVALSLASPIIQNRRMTWLMSDEVRGFLMLQGGHRYCSLLLGWISFRFHLKVNFSSRLNREMVRSKRYLSL